MAQRITVLLFLLPILVFTQNPVEYMESISAGNEKIEAETWDYMSAIARDKSARKIEKRRQEVEKSVREALGNVQRIKAYNNSTAYRDSSVAYLKFQLDVMTGKAKKLVDMESISEKSYDLMEAYILYQREINRLRAARFNMIKEEQQKFATANNVNLVQGKKSVIGEKIEKGSKILNYKEDMFLVYARCSMYEANMLQVMQNDDPNYDYKMAGLMLADLVDISRKAIDTITDVNADKSLRLQTIKALDFFKEEAEKVIPELSAFKKTTNEFKLLKEAFEKLSSSDKTKEKVDEFNKKVNEMNAASKKYNDLIAKFNQKRTQIYDGWNNVANMFVQKYVPR